MQTGAARGSVRREGEMIVISIHKDDALELQVALAPCPCRSNKSHGTERIRNRLREAVKLGLAIPELQRRS